MLHLFWRFTTKATNSPLLPSERGRQSLQSGGLIDLENEIAKLPRYHPERCPNGLIDLSGAENDLMLEYMVDKMEAFAKNGETSKCPSLACGPSDEFLDLTLTVLQQQSSMEV